MEEALKAVGRGIHHSYHTAKALAIGEPSEEGDTPPGYLFAYLLLCAPPFRVVTVW